ncbi:NAD(P)H-quinone oxidoreductase [Falsirhodobacter halotolerans]|uniref:NAD(P)H-quinone oxidoreductase n=1 Tax=Falsirhodobacter halotolerans TaxID=1146892 RepID=UPI001FD48C56|nr:NAD(P)H-quinone oxidoreductase [Falsirhodobacter halotolerans]MCJ8138642.1 NAD(P)H-quinone oxidoreductase [Falsirhodobacter halotolerans]
MDGAPELMRAIVASGPGGPEVMGIDYVPTPVPGYGEVLIRIAFTGVNRPDALQRAGAYPPPAGASALMGLECSGHIAAVGRGVTAWAVGDAVCALLPGGGYATHAVTCATQVLPIPEGLSMAEAACLPETCFTVWSNVVMRGGLSAGQRFLVHGGSSGIGTTAIQIATGLGARVFATAGTDAKCAACADLGAEAINYRNDDFVAILRAVGGADVILDMVGGSYIPRNIRALADDGHLVQIAFLEAAKAEVNFAEIMMRRLTVTGSTLRPQTHLQKARIAQEVRAHVWPMIAAGHLRPVMDRIFAMDDAADAHRRMEASDHIGKMALRMPEE